MTFTSEIATAAEFKKAMARDPGLVFIYGVLNGRQVAMTVASVMETTNEAVIYGPKKIGAPISETPMACGSRQGRNSKPISPCPSPKKRRPPAFPFANQPPQPSSASRSAPFDQAGTRGHTAGNCDTYSHGLKQAAAQGTWPAPRSRYANEGAYKKMAGLNGATADRHKAAFVKAKGTIPIPTDPNGVNFAPTQAPQFHGRRKDQNRY